MGWWSRTSPQDPALKSSDSKLDPAPSAPDSSASNRNATDKPAQVTRSGEPGSMNREEQAQAEYKQFLAEIHAGVGEERPSVDAGAGTLQTAPATTSTTAETSSAPSFSNPYPTSMSCRDAFDSAFYCQSLGGQFNSVYRYGNLRSCSDHWSAFWFCMRARGYPDEQRAETIRRFYQEKEERLREGPNSEEVWRIRTRPVDRAFDQDPDEVMIAGVVQAVTSGGSGKEKTMLEG